MSIASCHWKPLRKVSLCLFSFSHQVFLDIDTISVELSFLQVKTAQLFLHLLEHMLQFLYPSQCHRSVQSQFG